MVVLTQPTGVFIWVPVAGDLTPQREEENTQTHQTKNHSPAHTAQKCRNGGRHKFQIAAAGKVGFKTPETS